MGLNLTIDRGNTMTKVAVWNGVTQVLNRSLVRATAADILRVIEPYKVSRAIVCSVAGSFAGLEEELRARGVDFMTLTPTTPLPITVDYATPTTLGVDRTAAAVGAMTLFPGEESLIVDIGTAVTYDRLSAAGVFLGGNIAPGIGMRLNALNHFTARLPKVKSQGAFSPWGRTTETAMRAGAIYGVVAEVSYYRSKLPASAHVVLTGGWSADIARLLDFAVVVDDSLVTKGLNCILQYNENK